jgi:uncharacterized membrane protein YhaH (DUF805 family)
MEWMLMPLKRYADFSGRSRRKEYWMFALGLFIVYIILAVLLGVVAGGSASAGADPGMVGGAAAIPILIFAAAIIVPSIAVQVRRFHDQDKSGWFVLLALIPLVGGLIVLVFMCLEGTRGPNQYGPDPKGAGGGFDGPPSI